MFYQDIPYDKYHFQQTICLVLIQSFFFPSCEIQTTGHTVSHTPPTSQRQLCMKTFVVKAKPTSGGHRHKDSCILDVTLVLSNKTCISFFLSFFFQQFSVNCILRSWPYNVFFKIIFILCQQCFQCCSKFVFWIRLPPCVWLEVCHLTQELTQPKITTHICFKHQ